MIRRAMANDGSGNVAQRRAMVEEVQRGIELILAMNHGDVIRYKQLEEIIGSVRGDRNGRFRAFCSRLKKRALDEIGVVLAAVMNEGYKILPPNDQVVYAANQTRGASRRLRKAHTAAVSADRTKMTQVERQRADWVATRAGLMADAIAQDSKALRKLAVSPTPVNPWLPAPDAGKK